MNAIAPYFNEIKEKFQNNIKRLNLEFNEDIFMESIEKCNKTIDRDVTSEEAINYLWKAFRNNTLRELKYYRANYIIYDIPEDIEDTKRIIDGDFQNISDLIINKFGDKLYHLFALHANGKTYKELAKYTTIKNLKYKFRCIREYVRENYYIESE